MNNPMGRGRPDRVDDTIDLERFAETSDADLDLTDEDGDGRGTIEINGDGDGTIDNTVEIRLPDAVSYDVIGTEGDNVLTGGAADETFIGSAGDDSIVGGDGDDVIDYSNLGEAVTISSAGIVDKGTLGADTLGTFDVEAGTIEVVETVIGAESERNVVDATSVQGAVAGGVDLSSGAFTGNIVESAGDFEVGDLFSLTLENFVDVLGSDNDDQIAGDDRANLLTGAAGADTIAGGGGADTIAGGTDDDMLTGGDGSDTFEFLEGDGSDTVTDFEVGVDMLAFDGVATADIAAETDGTDTTLTYGESEIVLSGVVEEDANELLFIA